MKKRFWFLIGIVALVLIVVGYAVSQASVFTVYPVQCNGWLKSPPTAVDFSHCTQPQALARQTFSVNRSRDQVSEISPDTSDVYSLNYCTIQDDQHWSCGDGSFFKMPGGILAATKISRSGNNFNEYGLTAVIFVTESDWSSINNGAPGLGYQWPLAQ